ncbi:MAG: GspH/FimT family protein, partial [Gammaproteobacteria bacterium]|nr:GspH/FimT family protein [Gammaproteobacteria bacterium]
VSVVLHTARTEAIKQRADVTVCASSNWNTASPSCSNTAPMSQGWIVFRDGPLNNPNLTVDGGDEILYAHGPMNGDVILTIADTANVIAGRQFLNFSNTGFPRANVGGNNAIFNFQLCDYRGNHNTGGGIAAGRWIQLTPTGRPQIHRAQTEIQSGANPAGGC